MENFMDILGVVIILVLVLFFPLGSLIKNYIAPRVRKWFKK